jgi:hypothetical protein
MVSSQEVSTMAMANSFVEWLTDPSTAIQHWQNLEYHQYINYINSSILNVQFELFDFVSFQLCIPYK